MEKVKTSSLVKIAIFAFAVFAVIMLVNLQFKYNSYRMKYDDLKNEVAQLEEKRDELQQKVDAEVDDDYIINTAKDKLNLRLPEEVIFYNDLFN